MWYILMNLVGINVWQLKVMVSYILSDMYKVMTNLILVMSVLLWPGLTY